MQDDFYINGIGSGRFGVRLKTNWTVGSTTFDRTRMQAARGQHYITINTGYGLRSIKLPVHLWADSPRAAALQKSQLDAAMAAEPAELYLPDGLYYTASLDAVSEKAETTADGREIDFTYTLSGYAHDPVQTVTVPADGTFSAEGTAPQMDCVLTCKAGASATLYSMAGVAWRDVQAGDTLTLNGLAKQALRNGGSDFARTNLTEWPVLVPGANVLRGPDAFTVTYYPIWI